MPNPQYHENIKQGYSTWGVDPIITNFSVRPGGRLLLPRGYRKRLIELFREHNEEFEIVDERPNRPIHVKVPLKLRQYQERTLKALVLAGTEEGLIVAPAGSGKTVIGISLIGMFCQTTLWLTHTGQLASQAAERITAFTDLAADEIGFIGEGQCKPGKRITIGMVQTLIQRPKLLNEISDSFGMVILDEAHHAPAKSFTDVLSMLNSRWLFGLTATPYRRDKLESLMFQAIGPPVATIQQAEVEKEGGIIIPKVFYRVIDSPTINSNKLNTILNKYVLFNDKRTSIIVQDIVNEAGSNNFCIVISDRRNHCEMLYDRIKHHWPSTGIATGKYSRKQIGHQVSLYLEKKITVLVTTFALLGEGFDIPFMNRAFVTCPFRSEAKVEQLAGRIQRTHPEKKDAIIYDYVDHNIGVVRNQFYTGNPSKPCRYNAYRRLNMEVKRI